MKVLDLACQFGHSFEGWFGSEDDFQSQLSQSLVQCPICDDAKITKKLSVPRLSLSGAKGAAAVGEQPASRADQTSTGSVEVRADSHSPNGSIESQNAQRYSDDDHPLHTLLRNPEFQAAYMQMAKEVLAKTEDVGEDFAREARKIHYGESKQRGIRGQASRDETLELLDEGIEVMPLPLPKALKGPLQ